MPPKQQAKEGGTADDRETIRLDSLSIPELAQLRERLNADIQRLGEGANQMQAILLTINSSARAISQLQGSKAGQQILLPLTSSLYVPGELASTDTVLVDIGTGYYVEMTPEDGTEFCNRKIKKLGEQLRLLTANLREKQGMLMQVQQTLADKSMAAQGSGSRVA